MDELTPPPDLSPAQRKDLKALAHHLDPVVMIGEAGATEPVLAETDRALSAHGLIKIRVHGDDRELRAECMRVICERLGCAPVQMIGKLLVVWRPIDEDGGGRTARRRRNEPYLPKKAAGAGARAAKPAPRRKRVAEPAPAPRERVSRRRRAPRVPREKA